MEQCSKKVGRESDEKYMRRCLALAAMGAPYAAPNPMVGAVLVCDGRIIGEGFHHGVGLAHAEVEAFRAVKPQDRDKVARATLYVSLEPCSHYGRTPPCSALIVRHHPARVVVGMIDPFSKVCGRGIERMRAAGIEVTVGVLEAECRELNRRFITFHTHHRPYVALKWAMSADGFLDSWRTPADALPPALLSTPCTQVAVHHQRTQFAAILVGHSTLQLDRPSLTARVWYGPSPQPIVLGRVGEDELPAGWQCYADLPTLMEGLYAQGLTSLLVEGGARTLQSFIDAGLWDEAWEERSSLLLGEGVGAPRMPRGVAMSTVRRMGRDFTRWRNS